MNHTNNNRLDSYRIVASAAPSFATALIYGPMAGILPALIVKHFGVEMATMSSLLLLTCFFDGLCLYPHELCHHRYDSDLVFSH
ncbi:MAG: hypothetical protein JRH15_01635 [Deltaproteobacteria bacterium]|nr:hypothetical protein [Deltaproteobacteria bacterium]